MGSGVFSNYFRGVLPCLTDGERVEREPVRGSGGGAPSGVQGQTPGVESGGEAHQGLCNPCRPIIYGPTWIAYIKLNNVVTTMLYLFSDVKYNRVMSRQS